MPLAIFMKFYSVDHALDYLGLVVGAIIRFTGPSTEVRILPVIPSSGAHYNHSVPPDVLWLQLSKKLSPKVSSAFINNRTFVYTFKGEIDNTSVNEIDQKVQFILPSANFLTIK